MIRTRGQTKRRTGGSGSINSRSSSGTDLLSCTKAVKVHNTDKDMHKPRASIKTPEPIISTPLFFEMIEETVQGG
jgi:hypothetical protein